MIVTRLRINRYLLVRGINRHEGTSSTSNNNIVNTNKEYNPCAGKGCNAYGKNQLRILYINKIGWFCDSCAKDFISQNWWKKLTSDKSISNDDDIHSDCEDLSKFIEKIRPNLIKIPFKTKKSKDLWGYLQDTIGSYTLFEEYRKRNIPSNWGIITGKLLQGQFKGKYLVCIDLDNKIAIDVFLSFFPDVHSIEELSRLTIVIQHEDARKEKLMYTL